MIRGLIWKYIINFKSGSIPTIAQEFEALFPLQIDPLQGGHILAQIKVEVIKQPLENKFDKTYVQIQEGLNSPEE